MADLNHQTHSWICQGPSYIIEITINNMSNEFENMLRMFRYKHLSPTTNGKTYVLNIRGPHVLIMNDTDRTIAAYHAHYDGYNVRSTDGTMEFMFKHDPLINNRDMTIVANISDIREWIIDTEGHLFGHIAGRIDFADYTWNIPEGLKEHETGIGKQNGAFAVVHFRTISRNGITPCFVSFDDISLYKSICHSIYSEKISNTPPKKL